MNVIDFGQKSCEKVRRYLDSYMSNELLIETNHEVLQHLEKCPACSGVLEERVKVRSLLRTALHMDADGTELEQRIRKSLEATPVAQRSRVPWYLAVAAMLVMAVSAPRLLQLNREARDAAVLKVGLEDHVHCAVGGFYPAVPPTQSQLLEQLGTDYAGLVPVMAKLADYQIRVGHHCRAGQREFVHMTLKNTGSLLSLVITERRPGEALNTAREPVVEAAFGKYSVAGFETGKHLAFIVSDLETEQNRQQAASVAPGVRRLLASLERYAERQIPALALLQRPSKSIEFEAPAIRAQ
jgi:hypothetical protein